jgi:hypothetical protein
LEADDDVVKDALVVVRAGVFAAGADVADGTAAVPPIGAVDWPLICDWTVALNWPVMPVILMNIRLNIKYEESWFRKHTCIWKRMQEQRTAVGSYP